MTALLIQLFPSAGAEFHASGAGSIGKDCDQDKLVEIVASFFKIAEDVRNKTPESEILLIKPTPEGANKSIYDSYFPESRFNGTTEINRTSSFGRKLIKVGRIIAEAVHREGDLFPDHFVNNLLEAYAWSVIDADKLDMLSQRLKELLGEDASLGGAKYESKLAKALVYNTQYRNMPFYAGQNVISNSLTNYNGCMFADCVETMVRQLLACILCKTDAATGKVVLDVERIRNCPELMEFFAPQGAPKDIIELANDGSSATRKLWAEVVSGRKSNAGIEYCKRSGGLRSEKDCELESGWNNIIKIICYLLRGCDEIPDVKDLIGRVNSGELKVDSKERIEEVLKTLFRIRTDIETPFNIHTKNFSQGTSEVYGDVDITFNGSNLILTFNSQRNHSDLKATARDSAPTTTSSAVESWIDSLYYRKRTPLKDETRHLTNEELEKLPLSDFKYPFLEYINRLSELRVELKPKMLYNALKMGFYDIVPVTEHSISVINPTGAARLFSNTEPMSFRELTSSYLYEFKKRRPEGELLSDSDLRIEEHIKKQIVEICRYVLKNTEMTGYDGGRNDNFLSAVYFINENAHEIFEQEKEIYKAHVKIPLILQAEKPRFFNTIFQKEDLDSIDTTEKMDVLSNLYNSVLKSTIITIREIWNSIENDTKDWRDSKEVATNLEEEQKKYKICCKLFRNTIEYCCYRGITINFSQIPAWIEANVMALFEKLHPNFDQEIEDMLNEEIKRVSGEEKVDQAMFSRACSIVMDKMGKKIVPYLWYEDDNKLFEEEGCKGYFDCIPETIEFIVSPHNSDLSKKDSGISCKMFMWIEDNIWRCREQIEKIRLEGKYGKSEDVGVLMKLRSLLDGMEEKVFLSIDSKEDAEMVLEKRIQRLKIENERRKKEGQAIESEEDLKRCFYTRLYNYFNDFGTKTRREKQRPAWFEDQSNEEWLTEKFEQIDPNKHEQWEQE